MNGQNHQTQIYVLDDAIAKTDDDDEQSGQSSLESRDQLSKDQQAWS